MEKINVTLAGEQKELVIREGSALSIAHPKPISITGVLAAPFQFYEGKAPLCDSLSCHLQIKKDQGVIILHVNDTDPNSGHTIIGQLKKDSALDLWKINTEKRWTVQEFLKFIKTVRYYFSDPAEQRALVESLQAWNAKIETVIKNHNDNAGNSLAMLEKKVSDIGLKNKFNLSIPIFQGYPKVKVTVEIGLDPKSNSVDLFLISDELHEQEIIQREALIASELAKFDGFPCSKVVLS